MSIELTSILAELCTLNEAAALGVSRTTLWRWQKTGRLRVYRVGREALIEKSAVEVLRRER